MNQTTHTCTQMAPWTGAGSSQGFEIEGGTEQGRWELRGSLQSLPRKGGEVYMCEDTEINRNRHLYMNVFTNIHSQRSMYKGITRTYHKTLQTSITQTHTMAGKMITKLILESNLICNLTNKKFPGKIKFFQGW